MAVFFSSATVAGAFSTPLPESDVYIPLIHSIIGGLLASAIHNMDGIGGKPGWAW